jgi:predicted nucleic-acid-binding protein
MLAVDTNVLVRIITNDEPGQVARARKLVGNEDLWVSTTVLLETEWVLRSLYGFAPSRIVSALRMFAGLPRVSLQEAALIAQALDWCEQGMDFADALHLGTAAHCQAFVTFDKHCVKAARRLGLSVREP